MKKRPSLLPRVKSPLHEAEVLPAAVCPELLSLVTSNTEHIIFSYNLLMETYEKYARDGGGEGGNRVKYLLILTKDVPSPEIFQHLSLFSIHHKIKLRAVPCMWSRAIEEKTGRKNVVLIGVRENNRAISRFGDILGLGATP